ncbi:MAG TPA: bifunctional DNA-formamidopyrimidine glycosylase/DNA-(apurinic or apyrimidinic site) lyase [Candidatus Saccharimonadales bacterium]|nr:bifunctional DNA-formamidopyrimidine glycosylase/DNA-(apurinic or apyrimidinic site) lyase [Candidatus Saccharimonadales bacterium]
MPELPEVETIRIGLSNLIVGERIASEWHDWPKSFQGSPEDIARFLIGATVMSLKRRAKVLLIELSSKYTLLVHLKMTGQLVYKSATQHFGAGHPSDSLIHQLPDKSTHVILTFAGDSQLFFNDQRKFGWMRLIPTAEVPMLDFFKKLGPEPLAANFIANDLQRRLLRRGGTSIKAALLDQTIISGVGNIYADESLWAAKIHPATKVGKLTQSKINTLYHELRRILRLSIEKGGSTDKTYVDAKGQKGSYLQFAQVFRREGQPCPRCGTPITKIRVAGRGTHICPNCQQKVES